MEFEQAVRVAQLLKAVDLHGNPVSADSFATPRIARFCRENAQVEWGTVQPQDVWYGMTGDGRFGCDIALATLAPPLLSDSPRWNSAFNSRTCLEFRLAGK